MRRPSAGRLGWNEQAAVALLVVCARHLLAAELPPLTPARLARFVTSHNLAALVAALEDSPRDAVRHGTHQLRRLIRAGLDLFPPIR